MAAVPPCGLGCRVIKLHKVLKEKKKHFLIYSVFYLLLLELLSFSLREYKNYACFWYPLLTQIGYSVLLFSLFLWKDKLGFCLRKNISIFGLFLYYTIGVLSILFGISGNIYIQLTLIILFGISMITALLTFFSKN